MLREQWLKHIEKYEVRPVLSPRIPWSITMPHYIYSSEGERFGSANRMIQ